MAVEEGSVWKCVDEEYDMFGRYCVVKDVDNNPDFNGENTIEVLYADGSTQYPKLRRFVSWHKLIKLRGD